MGLCPFHSEKDPSFTASPSKQMFHCFGCKKGGDIFAFWMEYHKVSFPQALRDLADRYQIALPTKQISPSEKRKLEVKESLFKMNEVAVEYFHETLIRSKKGRPGREYFDRRSVSKKIISEFLLGYAPDEWDGLTRYFRSKKMDMEKAVQAGLITPKKTGGYYDRFRGRVVFPILNLRQQIVGFGGRVLDDSLPKYLNSPETPIFHKGELLYGLHTAYKPIRESGRAVVVEGYTDVLALRMHGFQEAVATLGTALTQDHIRKLKGYAEEAVVVFDSDSAGKTAAINSLSIFLNEGMSSRVMVLPEGDDPDSFINENGLDGFLGLLERTIPLFEFYIDLQLSRGGDRIEGQVNVLKEILPVLNRLDNAAQRSLYVRRLSEKLGIDESAVLTELRNLNSHHAREADRNGLREKLSKSKPKKRAETDLLNLFIHHPHTMDRMLQKDCKILVSDPIAIEIFNALYEIYTNEGEIPAAEILDKLEGDKLKERFREAMLSPPIYPGEMVDQAMTEFEDKINKIRMSASIHMAREQGDLERLNQLLKLKSNR